MRQALTKRMILRLFLLGYSMMLPQMMIRLYSFIVISIVSLRSLALMKSLLFCLVVGETELLHLVLVVLWITSRYIMISKFLKSLFLGYNKFLFKLSSGLKLNCIDYQSTDTSCFKARVFDCKVCLLYFC